MKDRWAIISLLTTTTNTTTPPPPPQPATLRDGRGDMLRVLGMKAVALLSLLKALDEELAVLGKLGKVCHISYGHASRFDQRFKVRACCL